MSSLIPICIAVDVEPDARLIDLTEKPRWHGFELLVPYIQQVRSELASATGKPVHFAWMIRMDPQIGHTYGSTDWGLQTYHKEFAELKRCGDELGIHVHMWEWSEADKTWIANYGSDFWAEQCVQTSIDTYRKYFGHPPRLASCGDRVMSNRIVKIMERAGIQCDLTLEPGKRSAKAMKAGERTLGILPDYQRIPTRPYQPSLWNYRRPGRIWKRNIWFYPLTSQRLEVPVPVHAEDPTEFQVMLLGKPMDIIRQVFDSSLQKGLSHLHAVARSDVLSDDFNGSQFRDFFNYLCQHPHRKQFVIDHHLENLRRVA